jgi:hypothetical protein
MKSTQSFLENDVVSPVLQFHPQKMFRLLALFMPWFVVCSAAADEEVCVCDFYLKSQNSSTQWTLPFVHDQENCTLGNCDEVYEQRLNAPAIETFFVAQAELQDLDHTWRANTSSCPAGCPCIQGDIVFSNNCTLTSDGRMTRTLKDDQSALFYYMIPYEVLIGGPVLGYNWTLVLDKNKTLTFLLEPYHACSEVFVPPETDQGSSSGGNETIMLMIIGCVIGASLCLLVCAWCCNNSNTKGHEASEPLLQ